MSKFSGFYKIFAVSAVVVAAALFASPVVFMSRAQEIDSSKVGDYRKKLEEELAALEAQIEKESQIIKQKQLQSTTLERDIAIFDAQINKAKLEIKARNIVINDLADDINQHSKLIAQLEQKLDEEKVSLAELIREMNELDSVSLPEIMLGYDNFSDFWSEFLSFESVQKELQSSLGKIEATQTNTEKEKETLQNTKSEQLELRSLQELEKRSMENKELEKKSILKATKGEEKIYQKLLDERKKNAAAIRSQLFLLQGSPAIPFEKAVEYANVAFKATGVRQAFLLGVISEESNLGANVGKGNWQEDMSHSKCASQREAFLEITSELGFDPNMMPVSKKAWYGYCGGAMGPAQFMPTTWQLYRDKIARITGHNPPNPWDPLDAFVASALLLKDNGAAGGSYAAERKAALKYLAGSNWSKSAYAFYGDDVMALAAKYQEQIDIISK